MIDLNTIRQQAEASKKMIDEMNNQNRIFENSINSALRDAPESDKKKISDFQSLSRRAISLAKSGKLKEAQTLIKQFKNVD